MFKSTFLILLSASSLLLSLPEMSRAAAIENGSFETGDFTGWQTIGQTSVDTSGFGVTPTDGTYQAVLETCHIDALSQACDDGIPLSNATELENFLNLSENTLSDLGVTEGSAIKQDIFINAGQVLSFSWNFLTDEFFPTDDYNDFGFFTLSNNLTVLADTHDATNLNFFSRLLNETGYFSHTITQTGTYTLGFGVVDVDLFEGFDTGVNSALLVDNVNVVPEPLTILGSFVAVGFGAFFKKKVSDNG
ncbi:PEP-CTERM sorting domain-containing protein [Cyanothece sp. BG0011]|uniref:PEP-CTERM sorting domain-containing protein n=1 Tax=Cyanothece sp. BG0011 TaxID=2082950 RepID=UPI000D1F135C|nr:PEP-CTERM sorting domain-containing protein [Cyanothece sp. BG0011]